jgi:hypothetical protein
MLFFIIAAEGLFFALDLLLFVVVLRLVVFLFDERFTALLFVFLDLLAFLFFAMVFPPG